MYSTIPIHWIIKSAPASPGRGRVGPAFYVFSFLGCAHFVSLIFSSFRSPSKCRFSHHFASFRLGFFSHRFASTFWFRFTVNIFVSLFRFSENGLQKVTKITNFFAKVFEIGHPWQDNHNRTAGDGYDTRVTITGQIGVDGQTMIPGTGHQGHDTRDRTSGTGHQGKGTRDRKRGTGHQEQDTRDRTLGTGHQGKDTRDRTKDRTREKTQGT